jgi:hypothetical protein
LNWIAQGWIEAASGPRIDGARVYRFDKQAIIQRRQERLVSSEARALLGIKRRTKEDWIERESKSRWRRWGNIHIGLPERMS